MKILFKLEAIFLIIIICIGVIFFTLRTHKLNVEEEIFFVDKQTITMQIANKEFKTKIATSDQSRAIGFMNRAEIDDNEAILFVFEEPQIVNFWMKNTFVPLDIIYLNNQFKIIGVDNATETNNQEIIYSSNSPVKYVVEIKHGIIDGNMQNNFIKFILNE